MCDIRNGSGSSYTKKLKRNIATETDNIPAEFIQTLGEKRIQAIISLSLINKIYSTGIISHDFLQTIFITVPKVQQAQKCAYFRTISLISHTLKILLYVINSRITPIIKRHLSNTEMGFRQGRCTKDAIFQFRTIAERSMQVNKKVYARFVYYQKAFDRINHKNCWKQWKSWYTTS